MSSNYSNVFSGVPVVLDGNSYFECMFHNCRIIYLGGKAPEMKDCKFSDCEFVFEGPAAQTVQFLSAFAHGSPGADEFVIKGILGLEHWAKTDGV